MNGEDGTIDAARQPWRRWVALIWLLAAVALLVWRWKAIGWFSLPDTDDNMRMSQVRALLAGQSWFDLRQYKLDPPLGASIHWSRLVDLPLAAIILPLKPLFGQFAAEKAAAAIAPLLPLGAALFAMAVTARRLVAPLAFALACAILLCAQSSLGMWTPLRVDHHGWQIALVLTILAGLVDSERARGGAVAGLAAGLSLVIGLEMLPQIVTAAAAIVLMWAADQVQARRLAAFGAVFAGASAAGYAGFASIDNRAAVCDALSPVWLSMALGGGGLAALLAAAPLRAAWARMALAAAAGAALVAFYVLAWPHCLGRLEGVSPELERLWLSHVREAQPTYTLDWKIATALLSLPLLGLAGGLVALWRARGDREQVRAWAGATALTATAFALLFWQVRAGPVAQALAVPGATLLGWLALPRVRGTDRMLIRVFGTVALFLAVSGLAVQFGLEAVPKTGNEKSRDKKMKVVGKANGRCPTIPALAAIEALPAMTVLTFVDLGPRLITVTHHRAIAGPYHRNQAAILDVMHAWRGTEAIAHDVVRRHRVGMVLICPGMSESTIYMSETPKGFYAQILGGKVPGWMTPVRLPHRSPFRAWIVAS